VATARSEQGSALIVVLVMIVVLTSLAAFLLSDSYFRGQSAADLTEKSKSLHLAEAGVDRAIADLNRGTVGTGVFGTQANPVVLANGSYYTTVRDWSTDGVDNDGVSGVDDLGEIYYYTITCTAKGERNVKYPLESAVEVIVKRQPFVGFARAMFGKDSLSLGGTIFTDSYDSALGTYAAQAVNSDPHTPGKAIGRFKGDVGSNGPIGDVGTVDVYGNSTAGPGFTTTITSNCFIYGSTAPSPTPVTLPTIPYTPPAGLAIGAFPGLPATLGSGNFRYASISMTGNSSKILTISGNATIYLEGNMSVGGQTSIKILPGASLKIYNKAGTLDLTGGGVINQDGNPASFQIFSEAATEIKITGNSGFYGIVYAPTADVKPAGTSVYYGSMTGKTIQCQGTADFHYDEALGRIQITTPGPCEVKAWRQIK